MKIFLKIVIVIILLATILFGIAIFKDVQRKFVERDRIEVENKQAAIEEYMKNRIPASAVIQKVLILSMESMDEYYSKKELSDEEYIRKLTVDIEDLDKAIEYAKKIPIKDSEINKINQSFIIALEKYRINLQMRIDSFPQMTRQKIDSLSKDEFLNSPAKKLSDNLVEDLNKANQLRKDSIIQEEKVMASHYVEKKDSDNDGLGDFSEKVFQTNPNNPDTDNDGNNDGAEVLKMGKNPNGEGYLWEIYRL